jgi:hypothetical protein
VASAVHSVAVGTAVEAAAFVPNCIVHTAAVSAAVVNTDPVVDSQAVVVVVPAVVPQIFYRQGIAATQKKFKKFIKTPVINQAQFTILQEYPTNMTTIFRISE